MSIIESDVSLDIMIATAKKYPRDEKRCIEKAEYMALMSQDIAESCVYSVPRAGKTIQGASVRLAEIFASVWGNCYMAAEVKCNDGKSITARAYCWDVENNSRVGVEVKRSIIGKNGVYSNDMQNTTENAACSVALRNAIFKVIPRVYIDSLVDKCIQKALGNTVENKVFEKRRQDVFDRLKEIGINENKVLEFYGKKSISEFTPLDIGELIGIGTAIKEGNIKIEEAFVCSEVVPVKFKSAIENKLCSLNRE